MFYSWVLLLGACVPATGCDLLPGEHSRDMPPRRKNCCLRACILLLSLGGNIPCVFAFFCLLFSLWKMYFFDFSCCSSGFAGYFWKPKDCSFQQVAFLGQACCVQNRIVRRLILLEQLFRREFLFVLEERF